jgi:aldehyde:ferredoxin oxidoreductase
MNLSEEETANGYAGKILRINLTTKSIGWDLNTGRPTRKTLEELGLKKVTDHMATRGKIGV